MKSCKFACKQNNYKLWTLQEDLHLKSCEVSSLSWIHVNHVDDYWLNFLLIKKCEIIHSYLI